MAGKVSFKFAPCVQSRIRILSGPKSHVFHMEERQLAHYLAMNNCLVTENASASHIHVNTVGTHSANRLNSFSDVGNHILKRIEL